MKNDLFWNIKKPISYNCLFNFIIGMRGVGKTYTSLKYALENFQKSKDKTQKQQFLYLRRYKTELKKLTTSNNGRLFNAVQKEFPTVKLSAKHDELYMNDELCGYAQALTTSGILKSDSFPNVTWIIFDEFIIDNRGAYRYLKDEVRLFLELYETISRGRDVRVLFLSNAISITNPYFDYWHLNKPINGEIQRFGKTKDILVQFVDNPRMSEYKKETRFGQIISGTDYSDYAYDNQWLLDNTDFIAKKTQRCNYFMTIKYMNEDLGIWLDPKDWVYYVSLDVDKQNTKVYSVTTDDMKPNIMLFRAGKKLAWLKNLIEAYENGCVYYENMKLKNWFQDIMRMARI